MNKNSEKNEPKIMIMVFIWDFSPLPLIFLFSNAINFRCSTVYAGNTCVYIFRV